MNPQPALDSADLAHARIRPARTDADVERAAEFLGTARVREIVDAHPEERGAVRLCEVDDALVGAILIDPSPLPIRDVPVRCARILETGGEDGRTRFRARGERDLFELLLEEALGYVWVKRYPVAFVHGELALYPEHGFVPCFYHPRVYVPVAAARGLDAPYRVRHLKADDVAAITRMRDRNRAAKPVVFAMGVPPFHHFSVEGPGRRLAGYVSVLADGASTWIPRLFAPEVEVEDRAAARTVLRHCADKAAELGLEEMHFPLGAEHPVARLCLELGGRAVLKGAATDPALDEEMIHVVDPTRLVAALRPAFERRLAAEAPDVEATIPIATGGGCWALRVAQGKVALPPLETRPEDCVELPHWKLTQLLAGYRGVDELDADLSEEHAELLDLLLPKTWPFSLPDPDHFDDVPPPRPWADAARREVARVHLPWTAR